MREEQESICTMCGEAIERGDYKRRDYRDSRVEAYAHSACASQSEWTGKPCVSCGWVRRVLVYTSFGEVNFPQLCDLCQAKAVLIRHQVRVKRSQVKVAALTQKRAEEAALLAGEANGTSTLTLVVPEPEGPPKRRGARVAVLPPPARPAAREPEPDPTPWPAPDVDMAPGAASGMFIGRRNSTKTQ